MESIYFKRELEDGGVLLCPCGCGAKPSKEVVEKLDEVRSIYGKPIYIEQGATCEFYSVGVVGRKTTSTHIDKGQGAEAVDIKRKTFKKKEDYFTFLAIAINAGFTGFGQGSFWIGAGSDKRLHIDTKKSESNDIRSWCYGVA